MMIGLLVDVQNRKRQPNFARSQLLWGSIAAAKTALLPESTTVGRRLDPNRIVILTASVVSTFWPYCELDLLVGSFTFIHASFLLGKPGTAFTCVAASGILVQDIQ